ncbi:cilia- and flagella-associated protein 69-like isoform X1 [Corythoichthys intestinalis]|uniref:cilia- and flagella-associated protein 69-like isoform X1 n=2 Tax=Corythoichthys intestinalis TaxID=161448 RepID=UPI0025A5D285|nr:cilia- and flagella-associated protein 69-like isoform X1 [Corythoichthys intestinalis]
MDSCEVVQRRNADMAVVRPRMPDQVERYSRTLDLGKVVSLLEDPLTTNMHERQIFVLKKLMKRKQQGFRLRELASFTRIIDVCCEKAKINPEYCRILCEALNICRLPFLKEKMSDELNYAEDVKQFLSRMGYLMSVPDSEVRRQVVESVKSFYSCPAPSKPSLDDPQPTSPGYRLQLLERSDLAKTLFLSIAALEKEPAIKLLLLQTLQMLSSTSEMNCALMLSVRGAESICLHMNEPDPSGMVLFHTSEILWNLLERGNKSEVASQLNSLECAISLKEAFTHTLLNTSRHVDLQVRNDLLVLTTLFAENSSTLLIESLFARLLVALSTFPELATQDPLVSQLKLTYNMEDLQMKKLLLNLLVVMSRNSAAIPIFKKEQVILALLTLAKPPTATLEVKVGYRNWSSVQVEELQLQALAVLATVTPLMLDHYMSCYGNVELLHLLDWCARQDGYFGQGHSFHATGGRGSKKAHLRYCIRLMRSVTSLADTTLNQDLCDQGTIHLVLGLLMEMESTPGEEDAITVEMKSDMQMILSALCEGDMHKKELFGSEGVEMTVHFLRRGAGMFYSGLGHNKLLLSTLVCLRTCIVGCYTTEDCFLAEDGVLVLLDLLNSSPRNVHGVVLATLLELCDNQNTVPHILSWSDSDGLMAPSLLLRLWRQEEENLGIKRNEHGGILDPKQPILAHRKVDDKQLMSNLDTVSATVLEMQENLLAKIYLTLCRIGFEDLPGLSIKDRVTLSIIKRYLDFKVSEVWDEITRELKLEGIRPVTPDKEILHTAWLMSQRAAEAVVNEQEEILRQFAEDAGREETLMYKEMKSHWKQRQLQAKSWSNFVSRTSHYDVLKKIKEKREKHVEDIRTQLTQKEAGQHPEEVYLGQLMVNAGSQARGGVKLKVVQTPVMAAAHQEAMLAPREPDYFNTTPVKDESESP